MTSAIQGTCPECDSANIRLYMYMWRCKRCGHKFRKPTPVATIKRGSVAGQVYHRGLKFPGGGRMAR